MKTQRQTKIIAFAKRDVRNSQNALLQPENFKLSFCMLPKQHGWAPLEKINNKSPCLPSGFEISIPNIKMTPWAGTALFQLVLL